MAQYLKAAKVKKTTCFYCKKRFPIETAIISYNKRYCSIECKNNSFNKIIKKDKIKKISDDSDLKKKRIPKLEKELWKIFSQYIRLRDALRTTGSVNSVSCITCGIIKNIKEVDAGHFFSRKFFAIKYDEKNVHAQCKKCNMPPRYGEQYLYSKKIIEFYGEEELDRLTRLKDTIKKKDKLEIFESIQKYKSLVLSITNKHGDPWKK